MKWGHASADQAKWHAVPTHTDQTGHCKTIGWQHTCKHQNKHHSPKANHQHTVPEPLHGSKLTLRQRNRGHVYDGGSAATGPPVHLTQCLSQPCSTLRQWGAPSNEKLFGQEKHNPQTCKRRRPKITRWKTNKPPRIFQKQATTQERDSNGSFARGPAALGQALCCRRDCLAECYCFEKLTSVSRHSHTRRLLRATPPTCTRAAADISHMHAGSHSMTSLFTGPNFIRVHALHNSFPRAMDETPSAPERPFTKTHNFPKARMSWLCADMATSTASCKTLAFNCAVAYEF